MSSLRGEEAAFPNTTDVDELVDWARPLDKITVFATHASLELGTLERAHQAGLPGWDLIIVDEAHRASALRLTSRGQAQGAQSVVSGSRYSYLRGLRSSSAGSQSV